jgi:hypothetical protein
VERALVALEGELHVLRAIQGLFKVNSGSLPGGYKGGTPGPLLAIDTDLKRGHDRPGNCVPASRSARPRWQPTPRLRWLQGPAITDIKDARVRSRFDLGALPGPATTEIDSPHLRARGRLKRRVNLILSQKPSTEVNAWEFTGNRCGNRVGIWELERVSVRPAASAILWARHRDVICQTRTPGAPGAAATGTPRR